MFNAQSMRIPSFLAVMTLAIAPLAPIMAIAAPTSTLLAEQTQPMHSLENTEWQLTSWHEGEPLSNASITAQFQEGRLAGSDGCNRYTTSYQLKDKTLEINPQIATTRRACSQEIMAQSSQFLTRLGAANQYRITAKGNLEITYSTNGKSGVMIFSPKDSATTTNPLMGKTWYLTSLNGKPPLPNSQPTLELTSDRLAGSGGCNRFTGGYKLEDRKLTVNPNIASTMMACKPEIMDQESAFLQALASATEYLIDNRGNLQIAYQVEGQRGMLSFSPNPASERSPRAATNKTLYVNAQTVNCTGVAPQQCWQIKENLSDNWQLLYTPIVGFDYQPGYLYHIAIREQAIANPPADASSIQRSLVKVIAQVPSLWSDRPLTNWNQAGAAIPKAPKPVGDRPTTDRCRDAVRMSTTAEDRAIVQAGWSLFGAVQTYGKTSLIKAMSGVDGMCRPLGYQVFVFHDGRFAGTLSPEVMDARSNGSERRSYLVNETAIVVEYNRYSEQDPLCCPLMMTQVDFKIEDIKGHPLIVPTSTSIVSNMPNG